MYGVGKGRNSAWHCPDFAYCAVKVPFSLLCPLSSSTLRLSLFGSAGRCLACCLWWARSVWRARFILPIWRSTAWVFRTCFTPLQNTACASQDTDKTQRRGMKLKSLNLEILCSFLSRYECRVSKYTFGQWTEKGDTTHSKRTKVNNGESSPNAMIYFAACLETLGFSV